MPGTLPASPASTITDDGSMTDVDSIVEALESILEQSTDKDKVKKSIGARLYATARAREPPTSATSSMDADIDEVLQEYEGDADLMSEVMDRMKPLIGGRRKTRKSKRKARKTRTYSRRR